MFCFFVCFYAFSWGIVSSSVCELDLGLLGEARKQIRGTEHPCKTASLLGWTPEMPDWQGNVSSLQSSFPEAPREGCRGPVHVGR